MTDTVRRTRYTTVAMTLHWLIAFAIVFNLASGLFETAIPVHKATGITILVLSVLRLIWRLTHRPPPFEPTLKPWEWATATITHWTFYVLMIGMPLTGWLMTSAGSRKYPLDWYGAFPIPFLPVTQDKALAGAMNAAHEFGGYLFAALLALHIGAAVKHLVVDGDDTFGRMVPGGS